MILAGNVNRWFRPPNGALQEELAHRAGIDRTYIGALERSVYGVTIDVLDRIAVTLGVEAADLLRKPTAEKPPNDPSSDAG